MCVCQWNGDRVVSMCGAHNEAARREYEPEISAVKVAHELCQILTLKQLEHLSKPTIEWVARHFGIGK